MRRVDTFILACGIVLAALILRPILDGPVTPTQPQPATDDSLAELTSWTDVDAELSEFAALLDAPPHLDAPPLEFDQDSEGQDGPGRQGEGRRENGPERGWDGRDHGERGRGGRGRDGHRRPPMRRLTEDMIDRCITVANEVRPELADRLVKLRENNSEEFDRTMRSTARGLLSLAEMKERNLDLYNLKITELRNDIELHQIAQQWRDALDRNDATRAKDLEDQLRQKVLTQLALRLKSKHDLLKRFEERCAEMREQFESETSETVFEAMVDERVQSLRVPPMRESTDVADPAVAQPGSNVG